MNNNKRLLPYKRSHKNLSQGLRVSSTIPERVFWKQLLTQDKTGFRFLRQKPIGNFVVDFYCPKLKLAVEIDGFSHEETTNYDQKRTELLNKFGIKVIRYSNQQIRNDLENVWIDLREQIKIRGKEIGIKSLRLSAYPLYQRGVNKITPLFCKEGRPVWLKAKQAGEIYLFGNQDYKKDNLSFIVADKLKSKLPNLKFVTIKPNQDLPFENQEQVIIMDVVEGINDITLITEENIDKIQLPPRFSAHDFDLGFQLKYLQKLGKIKKFTIIGLPMGKEVNNSKLLEILNQLMVN